jgi:hypothetical protein
MLVMSMLAVAACGPKAAVAPNVATAPSRPLAAADPFASGAQCFGSANGDRVVDAPYPQHDRASFPPYPNAKPIPCIPGAFEFQTADDPATVLAWYRAHTRATWTLGSPPPNSWVSGTRDMEIMIAAPPRPTDGVNTVIEITPLEQ